MVGVGGVGLWGVLKGFYVCVVVALLLYSSVSLLNVIFSYWLALVSRLDFCVLVSLSWHLWLLLAGILYIVWPLSALTSG